MGLAAVSLDLATVSVGVLRDGVILDGGLVLGVELLARWQNLPRHMMAPVGTARKQLQAEGRNWREQ